MNYSYKGKILISTPDLSGDIFSRSVVLLTEHSALGAFGLVLNKKNKEMSQELNRIFGFPVEVYNGGPVDLSRIIFIVKGKPTPADAHIINEDFYITQDIDFVVSEVIDGSLPMESVKIFSGYSGWSPNQLETEVNAKVWTVVDVYNLDYTGPTDQHLWKNIMQNLGGEYLLWANAPENVSLN